MTLVSKLIFKKHVLGRAEVRCVVHKADGSYRNLMSRADVQLYVFAHTRLARTFDALLRNNLHRFFVRCASSSDFFI